MAAAPGVLELYLETPTATPGDTITGTPTGLEVFGSIVAGSKAIYSRDSTGTVRLLTGITLLVTGAGTDAFLQATASGTTVTLTSGRVATIVTGGSKTYVAADRGKLILRSNGGGAITDTLPTSLNNTTDVGYELEVVNEDSVVITYASATIRSSAGVSSATAYVQRPNTRQTFRWQGSTVGWSFGAGNANLLRAPASSVAGRVVTFADTFGLLTQDSGATIGTGTAIGTGVTIANGTTSSGTNTGDQTITLTGDVTGSGTGSFVTAIGASKVVNSMLANMADSTVKGRAVGAGTGAPTDLSTTQLTALVQPATTSLPGAMSAADKSKSNNWYGSAVYNVLDYGVAPGNTAAANVTAINALVGTGGTAPAGSRIYFPPGTYQFNAAWNGGAVLPNNYLFEGVRGATSLSWSANVAGDLIKTTTSGYYTEFRGIQFTTTVAQTAGYVIHFGDGAVGPVVRECIFTGSSGTATLAGLMSFDNNGAQGSNSGNEAYLSDILGGNFTGIGINLNSSLVQMLMKGVLLNAKNAAGGAATSCVTIISCGYLQMDNCDLIGGVNNLNISPTVGLVAASIFANNTFFDQSTGSSLKISGAGTVVRAHFIGCWFTLGGGGVSGTQGIEISTTGSSVHQGILFSDCLVVNTPAAATSNGFTITAGGDIAIQGCQIAGWVTGISVTPVATAGTTSVTITDNVIGPGGGVGANTTGVVLAVGSATYGSVLVQGNNLSGNTTPITDASTVAAASNKLIQGNSGLPNPPAPNPAAQLLAATTTYVTPALQVPANSLRVGTTLRFTLLCSTAATINTTTILGKAGTAGTTGDTTVVSLGSGTGTAVADFVEIVVTMVVRGPVGASAVIVSTARFSHNLAATGFGTVSSGVATLATATVNSTVANFFGVAITSSAASVITVQSAIAEVIQQ